MSGYSKKSLQQKRKAQMKAKVEAETVTQENFDKLYPENPRVMTEEVVDEVTDSPEETTEE